LKIQTEEMLRNKIVKVFPEEEDIQKLLAVLKREGKPDFKVTGFMIMDCISDCAYKIDVAV